MTPERLISLCAAKGISFAHLPGGGRPEWTSQEAAMALAGLPRFDHEGVPLRVPATAAFCYRWAGDESQRHVLYGCLANRAERLALLEGWPDRIQGRRYRDQLVRMAILEERYWFVMTQGQMWPLLMEVDDEVWRRRMSKKYEGIRWILQCWIDIAHGHIVSRIRGRGEVA